MTCRKYVPTIHSVVYIAVGNFAWEIRIWDNNCMEIPREMLQSVTRVSTHYMGHCLYYGAAYSPL